MHKEAQVKECIRMPRSESVQYTNLSMHKEAQVRECIKEAQVRECMVH